MADAKSIFAEMEKAVSVVAAAKAELDAASAAVQAASAKYQEAVKAAEGVHKTFASVVGNVLPSVRVKS